MPTLDQYRAKRDFRKTLEPAGKAGSRAKGRAGGIFVIHKHAATRLHYDLRLEHAGVLWSWAVTRGPSLDPSEKRLAVHVEDHPIDYAPFEGTIPKGEYGGGSVIVWDEGTWTPEMDPDKAMKKGHISFVLHGKKLNGLWHLVRLKPRAGEKRENWLLIKSNDAAARPGVDILAEFPKSVKSGLTIEEIASGRQGEGKAAKAEQSKRRLKVGAKGKTLAPKEMPFIEPSLATLHSEAPAGDGWLHEVKFDGYRVQAHISAGEVRLLTRAGLDWTKKFGTLIPDALGGLDCEDAIVDGEIVVLAESGISSFSLLQLDLSERRTDRFVYYVFDLLRIDGRDLRGEPLVERKHALQALLGDSDEEGAIRYSDHFAEPGKIMLKHVCRLGLEGIVSKRADAPYRSGRGPYWIKSKCTLRQEFVIGGYVPSEKTGRGLRSLLVGYYEGGALHYAGRVGTGFSTKSADDLKGKLDRSKSGTSPFRSAVPDARKVIWVEPALVGEVEFRSWTSDRILRHASFQGLREDKSPQEVVEEKPVAPNAGANDKTRATKAPRERASTANTTVKLTNSSKFLWPNEKVSKQDLLDYYASVWPRMEPFVVDRPLSLVRAPNGIEGQRFFQKHASAGMHEKIARINDPKDNEDLLFIRDFDGVAALVQLGVVEIHIWGSKIEAMEKPDQIVFDLDPDEGMSPERVRNAALDVHTRLDALSLPNFVKTSGGKGYHVVVPLKPLADWTQVKTFSHDFARALEQAAPDRYTATLSKKARTGKIFIDYLRNGRGSTTVAPYSSRAKAGATVSAPLTWQEVEEGVAPAAFRIGGETMKKQLSTPDAWTRFWTKAKALYHA